MDLRAEVKRLQKELEQSEKAQNELDRRVFYLKTLYDVSKDIFSSVESEKILRSFLLMAMGNFGATEGFILLISTDSKEIQHLVPVGLEDNAVAGIKNGIKQLIQQGMCSESIINEADILQSGCLPASFAFARVFTVESAWSGIFGLGSKLIGEPYNEHDWNCSIRWPTT